jgi:predicted amidohydrolase YtcJ
VQPFLLNHHGLPHSVGLAPVAKDDLDREPLLRGRFVLLARIDGHASWASNAVLSKLNNLPDEVYGGLIVRDKAGNPTGVFIDNAMDLIDKPAQTEAETLQWFETTMRDALRVGLTNIQDAYSFPSDIAFYQRHVLLENHPIPLTCAHIT